MTNKHDNSLQPIGRGVSSWAGAPSTWQEWGDGTHPALYAPDGPPANDDLAHTINARVLDWAATHGITGPELSTVEATGFGGFAALTHPRVLDPDLLVLSAQWLVAHYTNDDCVVDDPRLGAQPERTADRLAHTVAALNPLLLPAPYEPALKSARDEVPVKLLDAALTAYAHHASPAQLGRLQHETCSLFLSFAQAASLNLTRTMPSVGDYLMHRYTNTFVPTVVDLDIVGGWELPAHVYYQPRVRQATLLAGAEACLINDLCSLDSDLQQPSGWDVSLPLAIVAERGATVPEAIAATVDVHNAIMRLFEDVERDLLADSTPPLKRWLAGLRDWMGGCLRFHLTSSRYIGTPQGQARP